MCTVSKQVSEAQQLCQYSQSSYYNAEALRTPREHVQTCTNTQRLTPSTVIILLLIQRLEEIV